MIKYKRSTLIILFALLFAIFISGCYTIIHPPFTVNERVTKVIVKDKESDLNYEDEEYLENGDRVSENETHIYYYHDYYTYYDPFYDWGSYWNPIWYGHYYRDYYYYPWYRAYHPFAYSGYFPYSYYGYRYEYYPYYGYDYNYAYYRDYGLPISYKKRDFGRRQDYRVLEDNTIRAIRIGLTKTSSAGDAKGLTKNADTYSGTRTRRDEYPGTRSGNIGRSSGSSSSGSVSRGSSGSSSSGSVNRGSSGSSGSSSTSGRRVKRYDSQIENNSSIDNKVILRNQNIKNNSDNNQKSDFIRKTIRDRVEIINRAVGSYLNGTFGKSSKNVLKKEPSNYTRYESNNSRLIREFTNTRSYSPSGSSEFRSNFTKRSSPSSGGSVSKQGASNSRSSSSSSSRREKR